MSLPRGLASDHGEEHLEIPTRSNRMRDIGRHQDGIPGRSDDPLPADRQFRLSIEDLEKGVKGGRVLAHVLPR